MHKTRSYDITFESSSSSLILFALAVWPLSTLQAVQSHVHCVHIDVTVHGVLICFHFLVQENYLDFDFLIYLFLRWCVRRARCSVCQLYHLLLHIIEKLWMEIVMLCFISVLLLPVCLLMCFQQITAESQDVEARSEIVRKDEAVANEQAEESRALKEEVGTVWHFACLPNCKPCTWSTCIWLSRSLPLLVLFSFLNSPLPIFFLSVPISGFVHSCACWHAAYAFSSSYQVSVFAFV